MDSLNINRIFDNIEFYSSVPSIVILSLIACIWNVYLCKRIKIFGAKFLEAIKESRADPFGNYINLAMEYKKQQMKYRFLLAINNVEMIGALSYAFGILFIYVLWEDNISVEYPDRFTNQNCTMETSSSGVSDTTINSFTEVCIGRILVTLGQVSMLWSMALVICLIKYLSAHSHAEENKVNRNFIRKTGLISFFIIITGFFKELRLIEFIFEPLFQIIYFINLVKHVRFFYKRLEYTVNLYKVEQRTESVIRRANSNKNQFGIITFLNITGYGCLISGELISSINSLVFIGLYYGPCLFNYLYGLPAYQSLLQTP